MISGDDGAPSGAAEFTAETAGESLHEACRGAGLDCGGAKLLRLGSNAVYRLASSPAIVRVARDPDSAAGMERAVRVARWLESEGFPATRVLPGVRQPVTAAGRVVTFWESAQDAEEYGTVKELAELLRRLHRLEQPKSLGLPYFDPFAKVGTYFAGLDGVGDENRAFLAERAAGLGKAYDRLDFVLPFGLIHGDANIGNLLRDRDGQAILIDLDGFAVAPREWDLILTAMYYDRYGWHTRTEYEAFVHHYGFDVMNWPGYPVLADLRELMMVLWMGQQVSTDTKSAEEFARRVTALRTGGSRKDWRPF
ncbi:MULTISPECIES: phosphotransferase family protein [Streptomycetaceae]|uniref:phosphotransferase family protein n=1 Tax=Streptomycetaceae TaxID=2062 RepID=UPI000213E861|nr:MULTISPECIES: aminoglycoside phosphotransferase family protein [Streptomycetaceae]MYS60208.1 phosphotransferase [Streptomyces sp. SID5468]CCB75998.1 Aminoglycoside phosphotransferase (modular protein) [Streptantibioticus cattleyicolor NRRL 8057 = DSM 46488]